MCTNPSWDNMSIQWNEMNTVVLAIVALSNWYGSRRNKLAE